MSISLALYQPEIAGNVGAIIRLCACFDVDLHIIEPMGFPWVQRKIKQSALDYFDAVNITRHNDWDAFINAVNDRRILLMTTKTHQVYTDIEYRTDDILLAGSESAGVPDHVRTTVTESITIPIAEKSRSLNLAMSCGIVVAEGIRQLG